MNDQNTTEQTTPAGAASELSAGLGVWHQLEAVIDDLRGGPANKRPYSPRPEAAIGALLKLQNNEALFHCGLSRDEWHNKAWALYHAKTFDDLALSKLSIHTLRTVFDATYDALKTPNVNCTP